MFETGKPLSNDQHVAEAMNIMMRRHKAAERSLAQKPIAVGPGVRMVDATPYLRNLHLAEAHASVYEAINQNPEKYLKDPRPGYHYLWIDVTDQKALARVRSKRYIEITVDELIEDSDLPWIDGPMVKRLHPTHKGTDRGVYLYDVQLVCCSPETYERLFKVREAIGMARITSGIDKFQAKAERMDGIEVDFEVTRTQ